MPDLTELIGRFGRTMSSRVAAATELWLGFEEGKAENLAVLRRLLHTVKGEAHMLDLTSCGDLADLAESLVESLSATGQPLPIAGDTLLAALEGLSAAAVPQSPVDELLVDQLRRAIAQLQRRSGPPQLPEAQPCEEAVPHATTHPGTRGVAPAAHRVHDEVLETAQLLAPDDLWPRLHELRRLHSEQAVFHEQLREVQRMLRALLSAIEPGRSLEDLSERITKTLGYGGEIDRRLSSIRNEWSGSSFSMELTLDELDASVRQASVVSADRLLNQVLLIGRTTARTLGKEVEIRVHADTILEASVEKRLEPALLHLVRNAIDHGIEPAARRLELGKPGKGMIQISIKQSGSAVIASVKDDGAGINFLKLRKVLGSRVSGLELMNDEELIPYLFEQGVTTSDEVTNISGRGVGLDVVAREVALAGGQLRVDSTGPAGTHFLLNLPATLRGEVVIPIISAKQNLAIPARAVQSVVKVSPAELGPQGEWLRLRREGNSQLVRLVSLTEILGDADHENAGKSALILYHSTGLFALSVDSYDNPRPVNLQRSEELAFNSPLVRGVVPTPDGGVLVVLDVEALFATTRADVQHGANPRPLLRRQPRALVVEDAPVARELLTGMLRAIGLEVQEATDGKQGLALAQRSPPDLILTDIEMPYMNGIEMVTELRQSPLLARVPVIVLTTAMTESNLARLRPLGVTSVLSKQKFVEAELRELVQRCVKLTG